MTETGTPPQLEERRELSVLMQDRAAGRAVQRRVDDLTMQGRKAEGQQRRSEARGKWSDRWSWIKDKAGVAGGAGEKVGRFFRGLGNKLKDGGNACLDVLRVVDISPEARNLATRMKRGMVDRFGGVWDAHSDLQMRVGQGIDARLRRMEMRGTAKSYAKARAAIRETQAEVARIKGMIAEYDAGQDITGDGLKDKADDEAYAGLKVLLTSKEGKLASDQAAVEATRKHWRILKIAAADNIGYADAGVSLKRKLFGWLTFQRNPLKGRGRTKRGIRNLMPVEAPFTPEKSRPRHAAETVGRGLRGIAEVVRHPRQYLENRRKRNNREKQGWRDAWIARFEISEDQVKNEIDKWAAYFNVNLDPNLESGDVEMRQQARFQRARRLMALLLYDRIGTRLNRRDNQILQEFGVNMRQVREYKRHQYYETVHDRGGLAGLRRRLNIKIFDGLQSVLPFTFIDVDANGERQISELTISREKRKLGWYAGYLFNLATFGGFSVAARVGLAAGLQTTAWGAGRLQEGDLAEWQAKAEAEGVRAKLEFRARQLACAETSRHTLDRILRFFVGDKFEEGALKGAAKANILVAIGRLLEAGAEAINEQAQASQAESATEGALEPADLGQTTTPEAVGGTDLTGEAGTNIGTTGQTNPNAINPAGNAATHAATPLGEQAGTQAGETATDATTDTAAQTATQTPDLVTDTGQPDQTVLIQQEVTQGTAPAEGAVAGTPTNVDTGALDFRDTIEEVSRRKLLTPREEAILFQELSSGATEVVEAQGFGGILWNHYVDKTGDARVANLLTRMTRGLKENIQGEVDYTALGPTDAVTIFNAETMKEVTQAFNEVAAKADAGETLSEAEKLITAGRGLPPYAFTERETATVLQYLADRGQ